MHLDWTSSATAVEPSEVTVGIVETHQSMDQRDLFESGIDRPMSRRLSQAPDPKTHQRSKPGLRPLNATV